MLCNMLGLFALRAIIVHRAVMVFFLLVLAPETLDVTAKVVGGAPGGSIGGEGRAWCAPASTQHAEDLSCDTGRSAWHWEAL